MLKPLNHPENLALMKKVKMILLDVDGVLTNSQYFYLESQGWSRSYSTRDGYGIRLIQDLGIPVGIMSGRETKDLMERMQMLGIKHHVLNSSDKGKSLDIMMKTTGLKEQDLCYMGDELFDLPALRRVGFSVTVPDAPDEVKNEVHAITQKRGGNGAVRELIDHVRLAQGMPHPFQL